MALIRSRQLRPGPATAPNQVFYNGVPVTYNGVPVTYTP